MKRVASLISLLSAILLVSLSNYSCSNEGQSKDSSKEDSTAAIPIEISLVERGDVSANYVSTATLEADQKPRLSRK